MARSMTEPVDILTVSSAAANGAGTNAEDIASSATNSGEMTNTATLHRALFSRVGSGCWLEIQQVSCID